MEAASTHRTRYRDVPRLPIGAGLVVLVPLVLVAVHALPQDARRELAVAFADPTLPTAFTAHFVHLTTGHLVSNLILYAMVVPTAYLLARATGAHRAFRRGFLTVVLVFPLALSGLGVALGRPALGFGFSGLNMALFGLLTLLLGRHLSRRFGVGVDERGLTLFGLGVALVALRSLPLSAVTVAVAGGAACLALASGVGRRRVRAPGDPVGRATRPGDLELAIVGGALFCTLPFVAFSTPASVAAGLGLYVHFLGYALGYTVLYVADAAGLLA